MKRTIRINEAIKCTRFGDIDQTIQDWQEKIEDIAIEMGLVYSKEGLLYGEPDTSGMIDGFNCAIKELKDNIDHGGLKPGFKIRHCKDD